MKTGEIKIKYNRLKQKKNQKENLEKCYLPKDSKQNFDDINLDSDELLNVLKKKIDKKKFV